MPRGSSHSRQLGHDYIFHYDCGFIARQRRRRRRMHRSWESPKIFIPDQAALGPPERDLRARSVKSGRHVTGRQSQAARNANRDTIARYGRYSNSASPKCDKRYKRAREKSTRGNSENCEHRCTDFPRLRARFRIRFARTGRDRRTDFGVPIDLPCSAVPFYLFLSSMKSRAELRRPPTS